MIEVKQYPKEGYHMWYRNYFYVNLCTRDHDNSSCTDLRQKSNEKGKFVRETVSFWFAYLPCSFIALKNIACSGHILSSKGALLFVPEYTKT